MRGDGEEEGGEKECLDEEYDMDHSVDDGVGDRRAKYESGDKIPESSPEDGAEGCEHARGHDRGDGVGGIVPAVGKIKGQGQEYGYRYENESAHGDQAFFRMTLSITFETSSHLSTAVSITSKISFHLMIWTGSLSSSKSCAMRVRQMRSLSFSRRLISMTCWSALSGDSMA